MAPSSAPSPSDKPSLRRWARRRRAALAPSVSPLLTERLRALPEMRAARDILIYLALPGEVDIAALAADPARRWHVPRCAPESRLAVHRYLPGVTQMRSGPFGIREPDPTFEPESDPGSLDLVVVPALLLSESGDRLGYGGGYYDRLLPRLADGCVTVGVLPDALVLPALPRDPWDRALSIVVTETRTLRPGTSSRPADG